MHGIEQQFLALQKGFNELIPQNLLKPFDERELELVRFIIGKVVQYLSILCIIGDRWSWYYWPNGLEDQHQAEALHGWHSSGDLVLEDCWELQRGDEGQTAAVRDRVQQGPLARIQGLTGELLYLILCSDQSFQGSTGAAGPRLFTLHLVEVDTNNLPKAHTCFNRWE